MTASAGANGAISPSGAVAVNSGASQAFTITPDAGYHVADLLVDGGSVGALTSYTFTNVTANHIIAASFAANPAVPAMVDLTAAQVKIGNDSDGTTKIRLSWTPVPAGSSVQVYRAGFGNYPEYDDGPGPGSLPTAPSYPPTSPWVLTAVTNPGDTDENTTRDFYYYVAFVADQYGTHSTVSNLTSGTLNYILGDVTDGTTPGQGDNIVNTADVSLLGLHYGITGLGVQSYAYVDFGPTTDYSVNGRPQTDDRIGFEELVMTGLDYGLGSVAPYPAHLARRSVAGPVAASADELVLESQPHATAGQELTASLTLSGTGRIQALSTHLSWDPQVVEPVSMTPADWVQDQGAIVLTPGPGTVDLAKLGVSGAGLMGTGGIATVTFRVIASGDPRIRIESIDARDASNRSVPVTGSERTPPTNPIPTVTALAMAAPNPFSTTSVLAFTLAHSSPVDLSVYALDGRRVRTLVHETREPGEYRLVWDGRDDQGGQVRPGLYYVRFATATVRSSRPLVYLK